MEERRCPYCQRYLPNDPRLKGRMKTCGDVLCQKALKSENNANLIFQIFSEKTELKTPIITTNLIPSNWGKIFDSVTASAILDRLSLNGKFITFEGRSYRSKNK